MVSEHARKVPIFWGHGTDDPIVRFEYCQRCVSVLSYLLSTFTGLAPSFADPYVRCSLREHTRSYSPSLRSVAFLKSELKFAEGPDGLSLNVYPGMQHATCNQELIALKAWLERVLPAPQA